MNLIHKKYVLACMYLKKIHTQTLNRKIQNQDCQNTDHAVEMAVV